MVSKTGETGQTGWVVRWLFRLGMAAYLLWLLRLIVFRADFGTHPLFADGAVALNWFSDYAALWRQGRYAQLVRLLGGNVLLFSPLGAWLRLERPTLGYPLAVAVGAAFSTGIEAAQYIFGVGLTELDDLILNTLGFLLGVLFIDLVRKWRARHEKNAGANATESHAGSA